jgi:hypothetical protein
MQQFLFTGTVFLAVFYFHVLANPLLAAVFHVYTLRNPLLSLV